MKETFNIMEWFSFVLLFMFLWEKEENEDHV
jgi:hypothetical protein